ncbi:MAG: 16S rRNA (guanine(966)-N(2))-methyltransferase RsmD [Rickettsiaceae bacterium]|nr:16S rRNA (guanine(966)-N(2))-methyltransferase RsmD [Rickettsiaceae bacterium]
MKIISGRLKGLAIPTIKGANYRPSTGKLKEAIFSILSSGNMLKGANVLDLFSGTGSLAIESISRGAAFATCIDMQASHIKSIKEFTKQIGESESFSYLILDASNLPKAKMQYDVIFIDPPYFKSLAESALISLHKNGWLKASSTILVEVARKEDVKIPESYEIMAERIYGNSKLLILKPSINDVS